MWWRELIAIGLSTSLQNSGHTDLFSALKVRLCEIEFSGVVSSFEVTENVSTQLNRGFEQLRCAAAQRMSNRPWTHPRTCQTQTWGSGCSAVKLVTLDLDHYLIRVV